jgi:hypothetical protein
MTPSPHPTIQRCCSPGKRHTTPGLHVLSQEALSCILSFPLLILSLTPSAVVKANVLNSLAASQLMHRRQQGTLMGGSSLHSVSLLSVFLPAISYIDIMNDHSVTLGNTVGTDEQYDP